MKSKVIEVVHGETAVSRIPFTYVKLECEHSADNEGECMQVGDEVECKKCDEDAAKVEEMIAFCKTPDFSHLVKRDLTAGNTGAWMYYIAYRKDSTSPTACRKESMVKMTAYTTEAFRNAGLIAYNGPTRGTIAERKYR
jgi:hypothetical protein